MGRDRSLDPRRLDVAAFAAGAAELSGRVAQQELSRLSAGAMAMPADAPPADVEWQARGERRRLPGGGHTDWLRLEARTEVVLTCQRCLLPFGQALSVERWFRFAADEDEAARLDEELEEDVLVASARFDLVELIEDELILALPIVPRHEVCPEPLPADSGDPEAPAHPFAALAALRRPPESKP